MPLEPKHLDDRSYKDLLAEAKVRLRRSCPDWTDFNDSDPGMALVQLCTWYTDLMLYRINQVPERNYVSFLKRLNIERNAAQPARTHVVLEVDEDGPSQSITVPSGARFIVPTDAGAVTFEATESTDLIPHSLEKVQLFDSLSFTDVSELNMQVDRERFFLFGKNPLRNSAFHLGFHAKESQRAAFPARMVLYFFRPRDTAAVPSQGQQVATLQWEYQSKWDENAGDRWRPLTVLVDETQALTRQGRIVLRGPGDDILSKPAPKPVDDDVSFWIRCRLVEGAYSPDAVPEVAFIRSNVVEIVNTTTYQDEVLGQCDGHLRQFKLQNQPVVAGSLRLVQVGEGGREDLCRQVDDFGNSFPEDLDFTLNVNSGEIQFGDGLNGRPPDTNVLLVARKYSAGGGEIGNVSADKVTDSPIGVAGLKSVTNPRAAAGGIDEESKDSLLDRAGRMLRSNARAVTRDDYRRFAEDVPGVGRAVVLEKRLPQHGNLKIPGAVTVIVLPSVPQPRARGVVQERFTPSPELIDAVSSMLEQRKPVGTEVAVTGPTLRPVTVKCVVTPAIGVTENEVRESLTGALTDYFRPVRRSQKANSLQWEEGYDFTRWEIGAPIYVSSIYEILLGTTDRARGRSLISEVIEVSVEVDGESSRDLSRYCLKPNEIPLLTIHIGFPQARLGRRA